MIDWGEASYENTAATLVGVAELVVDALAIAPGERVLDLGCGTGNAALAAARRGARVVAVDPAARLVEVAAARAASEGLVLETSIGEAGAIPAADGAFDALVSNFAVIFAPDAEKAADEMVRVVRPGGRIAITTWLPWGPIFEAARGLRAAMADLAPPAPPASPGSSASALSPAPPPPWGDEVRVRALFESRGASVQLSTRSTTFEAASPDAWFAEQETNHPVWHSVRRALADRPERWDEVRARSVEALRAGNEAKDGFRVTSDYLIVSAVVA